MVFKARNPGCCSCPSTAVPCSTGCPSSAAVTFSINYTDCSGTVRTFSIATPIHFTGNWNTNFVTLTNIACRKFTGDTTNQLKFQLHCVSGILLLDVYQFDSSGSDLHYLQYEGVKPDSTCSPVFLNIDTGHINYNITSTSWINSITYTQ